MLLRKEAKVSACRGGQWVHREVDTCGQWVQTVYQDAWLVTEVHDHGGAQTGSGGSETDEEVR